MNIEQKIMKAFGMDTANSNKVYLREKTADKFIDYIQDESKLLKDVRKVKMTAPIQEIAKIDIGDDPLYPAGRSGTTFTGKEVTANAETITLTARKMRAKVVILDDELEDNIEGESFREHLMRMLAKKAGNQLEKTALYGRFVGEATKNPNVVSTLNQVDGFLTRAGVIVDASDTNLFDKRSIDLGKLKKLRKSFKNKYRAGLKTYLTDGLRLDYIEKYSALAGFNTVDTTGYAGSKFIDIPLMREDAPVIKAGGASTKLSAQNTQGQKTFTVASAAGITAGMELVIGYGTNLEHVVQVASISGTTVTVVDAIPYKFAGTETVHECLTDGAEVIMTDPMNLIWWVRREFTLAMERNEELEASIFYLSLRTDFQVENPEALGVLKNVKSL